MGQLGGVRGGRGKVWGRVRVVLEFGFIGVVLLEMFLGGVRMSSCKTSTH